MSDEPTMVTPITAETPITHGHGHDLPPCGAALQHGRDAYLVTSVDRARHQVTLAKLAPSDTAPQSYTVEVSSYFARRFADWTELAELADEFRIIAHEDGSAEMLLRRT